MEVQRFQLGERVEVGQGVVGVVVRTEILGDQPVPSRSRALAAASHSPGAVVYVVRYEINGETVEVLLEEDEITVVSGDSN
ncbi:MAG TPA: hypothetical protein VGW98_08110 [Solirubrobacteraceae bacterium]|jgi:hypothetical protein|nr:hypothetical protein [Solirubrobacteraceae bacterium]